MKRFAFVLTLVVLVAPMLLGLRSGTAAHAAPIFKNASLNIHQGVDSATGGVNVTLNYNCAPASATDTTGELAVVVAQGTIEAETTMPANCDGKGHTTTVFVAGAFTPGAANAQAEVVNGNGSAFAEQNNSIMIKG
jgi:hypothetical protein